MGPAPRCYPLGSPYCRMGPICIYAKLENAEAATQLKLGSLLYDYKELCGIFCEKLRETTHPWILAVSSCDNSYARLDR